MAWRASDQHILTTAQWQQRSQLFSNLSAFNLRSAQKRKNQPTKPAIGPLCEKVEPPSGPSISKNVDGLNGESSFSKPASTAPAPPNTPASATPLGASLLAKHPDEKYKVPQVPAKAPRVMLSLPEETHPRFTVALPCSDTPNADDEGRREPRQSLFALSDDSSDLASDEEADDDEDEDEDEYDIFEEEIVRTPLPSIDESEESEVAISVKSRTAKDSVRASMLHRTSSNSAALRPVRSRGESIGLQDCSKDPMVLAAGYEKKLRSRGLTTNDASNKRECFVYRSSGGVGRASWEICPGREALGGDRGPSWKGRSRGETM